MALDIAGLLQLDSGSSAVDSTNANERNRQFNRILKALEALGAAFETSFIGGAATASYTPVLSAGTGTFTSAAVTGRYLTVGKFTFIEVTVTITTNGTAATFVSVTTPNTVGATTNFINGRRTVGASGLGLVGQLTTATNTLAIFSYDGTYPGGNATTLIVSGWYENA